MTVAPPAAADGLLPPPVEQALIASASIDAPRASLRNGRMGLNLLAFLGRAPSATAPRATLARATAPGPRFRPALGLRALAPSATRWPGEVEPPLEEREDQLGRDATAAR